jgi:hypothetical protein
MNQRHDLAGMLAELQPRLSQREYVFCTRATPDLDGLAALQPFAVVCESEGLTLVLERRHAELAGLDYSGTFRRISMGVHSSLHAVGLTAAISGALAGHGISANMIAGFHHDHVFVPAPEAAEALAILEALQ